MSYLLMSVCPLNVTFEYKFIDFSLNYFHQTLQGARSSNMVPLNMSANFPQQFYSMGSEAKALIGKTFVPALGVVGPW